MTPLKTLAALSVLAMATATGAAAQDNKMGFFVTITGLGNGADLGGLESTDAHCTKLAETAGSTGRTWRAYLST